MRIAKYRKIVSALIVFSFLALSLNACSTHTHVATRSGKVPPGQAKKMSGEKSAKAYAPGQRKKR
ncbi:hypothetical protein [Flavobacterium foetidum]|uniref:hypothetical protein n=1 Tax=Flavobacterium foetidum TaxID=2026681 RepID=UPI001074F3A8|nr:hypothetical protein [Flavobacterium foetidum]KAF2514848.1 hypothetical protein E0W73_10445 [Flavobacterium foetidum]